LRNWATRNSQTRVCLALILFPIQFTSSDLPERYEKHEFKVQEANDETPDDSYRLTTIPPHYADEPDPDGYTKCIITSGEKKRLFASPLFLTCYVPQAKPDTVFIKDSPTGGLGMFAGRDIKYGELLFAERPLLVCPATARTHGIHRKERVDEYTHEDIVKIMCFEWEQQLEFAVSHMDPERREAYMALANSHKEDGSGPLFGVQRTNGFALNVDELLGKESTRLAELCMFTGMSLGEEGPGQQAAPKSQEKARMYSVIAKDGSRINHRYSSI
jgi:hypothetical protein